MKYPRENSIQGFILSLLLKGHLLSPVEFAKETGIHTLKSHMDILKDRGWKIQGRRTVVAAAEKSIGGRAVRVSCQYWLRPATIKAAGATGLRYIEAVEQSAKSN